MHAMTPQEKQLAQRAQTYHHHELRRMRRAAEAKQLGLDVHEFAMPWPGSSVNVHHTGGGLLKGALLAAALLAGGAGSGAWLAATFLQPQASPGSHDDPAEQRAATNVWDYEIDMQVIPPRKDGRSAVANE